jgi:sigma-B regulation protein RsbU (phosphoserine phosphatase)
MNDPHDAAVLADLNDLVARRGLKAMTTAAIVSFDRHASMLRFAYAGHYPIYARSQGSECWGHITLDAPAPGTNLPLGAFHGTSYDLGEVSLSAGHRLFLYTDGLIEAPSPTREPFGLQRLADVLGQGTDLSVRGIKERVRGALCEHTAGDLTHDDVTFLVVEPRSSPAPQA